MKRALNRLVLATTLAVISTIALAQNDASDAQPIVIEDLSKPQLRAEIEKIENEFYRVFNANINADHLKINCNMYTPTGSNIRQRACEPEFLVDSRNDNISNWQNGRDVLMSPADLRKNLDNEFAELTAALNAVMIENQYFKELNDVLRMLRGRMQELE